MVEEVRDFLLIKSELHWCFLGTEHREKVAGALSEICHFGFFLLFFFFFFFLAGGLFYGTENREKVAGLFLSWASGLFYCSARCRVYFSG